jgi:hypothetical protein
VPLLNNYEAVIIGKDITCAQNWPCLLVKVAAKRISVAGYPFLKSFAKAAKFYLRLVTQWPKVSTTAAKMDARDHTNCVLRYNSPARRKSVARICGTWHECNLPHG